MVDPGEDWSSRAVDHRDSVVGVGNVDGVGGGVDDDILWLRTDLDGAGDGVGF